MNDRVPHCQSNAGDGTRRHRRAICLLFLGAAILFPIGRSYALSGITGGPVKRAAAPLDVVLFLHGLGGSAASWDPFVAYLKQTHPKVRIVAAGIFNGRISPTPATRVPGLLASGTTPEPMNYCFYRINFGAYDRRSGLKTLPNNGRPARAATGPDHGDFESFDELGKEVDLAVRAILRVHPNARIALVGHSRGGLAARAFLQNPAYAVEASSVAGFLTQGTPENGSYFGRIHDYLAQTSPMVDPETWNVANAIEKFAGVDTFSPSIGFLATSGTAISALAATSGSLPLNIAYCNYCYTGLPYGELVTEARVLGVLHQEDLGNVFTQAGFGAEYHVSAAAETALIGTLDPEAIGGDSIVQEDSENLSSVATIPPDLNLTVVTNSNGIFHTYEPDQVEDIADGLLSSLGWEVNEQPGMGPSSALADADETVAHTDPMITRPAMELLEQWLKASTGKPGDDTLEWTLREAFIENLGNDRAATTSREANILSSALRNGRYPLDFRLSLAGALAETETLPATQALLEGISSSRHEGELHIEILKAIAHIGLAHHRDVLFAEDLSPMLERALAAEERRNDTNSSTAIASALLNIGAESGIEAVGRFAATRRPDLMEIDLRLGDSGQVRNPHAIPALSKFFTEAASAYGGGDPNERLLEFAGGNLIEIGTAESVSPVLEWLRGAPDGAAPLVNLWFSTMTRKATDVTRQFVAKETFRSLPVKAALARRVEANTPVE